MKKRMEDQNLSSASNQQSHTNEPNNQAKTQPDVTGPSNKINGPSTSHDNVLSNSNQQQHPPIVQWSYTPQNATQQLMAVSFPNQAPSPFNQWQHFLHQVHTCQAHQTPLPNTAYHVGYQFPGFPCSCNSSSWLGQMQQLEHSYYAYNSSGAPGFSSATTTMPSCSTYGNQSLESGTIKQTAKLSRKHQQLWDAQSVENIQLRSMVDKLQDEVSDHKGRLVKLEEEVSSLKQDYKDRLVKLDEEVLSLKQDYKDRLVKLEEVSSLKQKVETPKAAEVIGTIPVGTGQPPKRGRGRPKRSLASLEASHEPHPRAPGRKPALNPFQLESNSPIFEKVILKKVENKEISNHSTSRIAQEENNGKILNGVCNSMIPAYQGQDNQEYHGVKMRGSETVFSCASGVQINFERGEDKSMKMVYSEQSHPSKVLNNSIGDSTKNIGNTGNGNHGLTSSNDFARDVLDKADQIIFRSGSLVQQEENGEDTSEEMEVGIVRSSKDENEEEMGDDTSFSA
ncbi:PREDICTED: uncharacterized protein LOC109332999 [Lupinus angustifolius]|uniref:uncharacterized protein LOC109332999 n=1 Tax=Lupinus angustifolius TaxID=3871 RepID=UPI00092F8E17|nr:PREDICTED: uncharacterized protein LOC109332999 [Lupinus angustifolius]